jgi:hypothetical protein
MLRRVNSALFRAPAGARIQVVTQAQGNNGVNDARFEYAQQILPRETILGLPGCSFTVAGTSEGLEAVVVFDPAAPGTARYDLFEVENGIANALQKSVTAANASPLIGFTIDPVGALVPAGPVGFAAPRAAKGAKAKGKPATRAKKTARKKTAGKKKAGGKKKTAGKKTTAGKKKRARRTSVGRKTAGKKKRTARNTRRISRRRR